MEQFWGIGQGWQLILIGFSCYCFGFISAIWTGNLIQRRREREHD